MLLLLVAIKLIALQLYMVEEKGRWFAKSLSNPALAIKIETPQRIHLITKLFLPLGAMEEAPALTWVF